MIGLVVTPGFEPALIAELTPAATTVAAPGVVLADVDAAAIGDPVFARQLLPDAQIINAPSVKALAEAAYAALEAAVDTSPGPFTLHAYVPPSPPERTGAADDAGPRDTPATDPGLGSRAALVGRETLALLARRRKRAFARYVPPEAWAAVCDASATLLQLLALDRTRLLASAARPRALPRGGFDLAPWPAGAAPVTIDRDPPSRAYQKLEEAFQWTGAAPRAGETCVDLGASPGGWTMTALKRGARVIAVDRAALEPPASGRPGLTMTIGNAFTYLPPAPVDWLLCDVICEPHRTVALIETWLARRLCQNLVCTVKFKGQAGYGVLSTVLPLLDSAGFGFRRVKHLAHNKNEVTVMGLRSAPLFSSARQRR